MCPGHGLSHAVVGAFEHGLHAAVGQVADPAGHAQLLGGAIITETIFAWRGMGSLFITGLRNVDAEPVMGYFIVVGTMLVLANIVVDFVYAALDPRIRVNA